MAHFNGQAAYIAPVCYSGSRVCRYHVIHCPLLATSRNFFRDHWYSPAAPFLPFNYAKQIRNVIICFYAPFVPL